MPTIIVPLEPQSSPAAYHLQHLALERWFPQILDAKPKTRTTALGANLVLRPNRRVFRDLTFHLKFAGVPYQVV